MWWNANTFHEWMSSVMCTCEYKYTWQLEHSTPKAIIYSPQCAIYHLEKWVHKFTVSRQIIKQQGQRACFILVTVSVCQWYFAFTQIKRWSSLTPYQTDASTSMLLCSCHAPPSSLASSLFSGFSFMLKISPFSSSAHLIYLPVVMDSLFSCCS